MWIQIKSNLDRTKPIEIISPKIELLNMKQKFVWHDFSHYYDHHNHLHYHQNHQSSSSTMSKHKSSFNSIIIINIIINNQKNNKSEILIIPRSIYRRCIIIDTISSNSHKGIEWQININPLSLDSVEWCLILTFILCVGGIERLQSELNI